MQVWACAFTTATGWHLPTVQWAVDASCIAHDPGRCFKLQHLACYKAMNIYGSCNIMPPTSVCKHATTRLADAHCCRHHQLCQLAAGHLQRVSLCMAEHAS